jgi:hypothetical protein
MKVLKAWESDMLQTFKIVKGIDKVNGDGLFKLKPRAAKLEVRRNFFSNRLVDSWNKIPSEVKNVRTVSMQKTIQNPQCGSGFSNLDGDESGAQDGGVESKWMHTLPERPQRGHWKSSTSKQVSK